MAVVRELATGKPRNVPCNNPIPSDYDLPYSIPSFTTLVQGRYSGKTRFLLEQIKEDQDERSIVIYFTMKSKREEGKVSSKYLDLLLSTMRDRDLDNCAVLFKCFYMTLVNEVVDEQGYLKAKYSKWGGYHADCIIDNMATPFNFYDRAAAACYDPARKLFLKPHDDPTAPTKQLHVVIVIDEAHHLLKQKRTLRKCDIGDWDDFAVIHDLEHLELKDGEVSLFSMIRRITQNCTRSKHFRIPIILASSSPRILQSMRCEISYGCCYESDFVVSKDDDVVRMYRQPMILQDSMDIWGRHIRIEKSYYDYIRSVEFAGNLCLFGRPFWGALTKTISLQHMGHDRNDTVWMGETKFFCENRKTPTDVKALAYLGHTVFIEPISLGAQGTILVEAKMGFLRADANCPQQFVAVVHPEPVLAVVATKAMLLMADTSLCECLKRFCKMVLMGLASVDDNGKFVLRISFYISRFLAVVRDNLDRNNQLAPPCYLEDVLECLAPVSESIIESLGPDYLKSVVSFTHWINIEMLLGTEKKGNTDITFEYILERALIRSSAITMPNSCKAVGLVIPIVTQSGKLGAILVKVINQKEATEDEECEAFERMHKFAKDNNLIGRSVYLLAITSPTQETTPATISRLGIKIEKTLLEKLAEDVSPPFLVMRGLNFSFRENDPTLKNRVYSEMNKKSIRKILADLANTMPMPKRDDFGFTF